MQRQPGAEVTLRLVARDNWQEALRLVVRPEQQRFVAGYAPIALLGLAKAYVRPGGVTWEPYAIYAAEAGEAPDETRRESSGETMVGFVELAYEPGSADEYWVFHFFIDARFQRRGYARAALSRLAELVAREHPEAQALQLVVHPENVRAQRLYTSAGFRPTGGERWGEPAYRLTLARM
ncbi:MAG TPA: N-acetyltransferase [Ktedonobacterales bacterium]